MLGGAAPPPPPELANRLIMKSRVIIKNAVDVFVAHQISLWDHPLSNIANESKRISLTVTPPPYCMAANCSDCQSGGGLTDEGINSYFLSREGRPKNCASPH